MTSKKRSTRQSASSRSKTTRRRFPYHRVARMWEQGKTISTIAYAIGCVDQKNPKDRFHSLRNLLYRMHKGYKDKSGRIVKLPHRVSKATLIAARRAGLRAA